MAFGWLFGSLLLLISLFCIALYTRFLLAYIPRTKDRILLWIPLAAALFSLPRALFLPDTHIIGTAATAVAVSWWASHRALSTLVGYGPASDFAASSSSSFRALIQFAVLVVMPAHYILPHSDKSHYDRVESPVQPLMRAATTLTMLQCVAIWVIPFIHEWSWLPFHRQLLPVLYAWIVYSSCSFFIDVCSCIAAGLFQLPTGPGFLEPWKAASVAEFWNRWNRPAQDILRDAVYYPLLDAIWNSRSGRQQQQKQEKKPHDSLTNDGSPLLMKFLPLPYSSPISEDRVECKPSLSKKGVATFGVFFVSGLMHELTFFCISGSLSGELFFFFLVHGSAVIAEKYMKQRYIKVYRCVPRTLRNIITMIFVVGTAHYLFFPPLLRFDMVERCRANLGVLLPKIASRTWRTSIAPENLWNKSSTGSKSLKGIEI